MTEGEYEEARNFLMELPRLRHQLADTELLERCQTHLFILVNHVSADFEPHPETSDNPGYHEFHNPEPDDDPRPPGERKPNTGFLVERQSAPKKRSHHKKR